jgi:hypothetical protein
MWRVRRKIKEFRVPDYENYQKEGINSLKYKINCCGVEIELQQ